MTLLELCEPLFQIVCRLNRSARKGLSPDFHQVRAEVPTIFADMKSKSRGTPGLGEQYDKIELPLYFFVDSMISESALSFARTWNEQRLAEELNPPELGGEEKFFDLLEETLADRAPGAAERLGVFYTCLGLGFTGFYAGQPEYLRRKMNEISSRMRGMSEAESHSKICPEAYDHVNTADLVEPPGVKLVGLSIFVLGLIVAAIVFNIVSFNVAENKLSATLQAISQAGEADSGDENGGGS